MSINYKQCPECGSKNSLKIIYGMANYELFQEAEAGKIRRSCCCIIEDAPKYFCKDCEHEWNRKQSINAAYSKIKTIRASVGGFSEGYYKVDIDLVNLKTTWIHWGGEEAMSNKAIRSATAEKFIEQLKRTSLMNWKTNYIEPDICDGTQWNIEILTDERTISKYGSNMFPKERDLFCKVIKRLVHKQFYE